MRTIWQKNLVILGLYNQLMSHKSVLLKEVIEGLDVKEGETFVDATLGNAGHSKAIIDSLGESARDLKIIGIDADETATEEAKRILEPYTQNHTIHIETTYFDSLGEVLQKHHITSVDKVLFDLGFRSDQVDNAQRGFSFQKDGPLDMSFNSGEFGKNNKLTASEIVNEWQEESIADIIYGYSEERFARRIAKAIVEARADRKIKTTTELAQIVSDAVPAFYRRSKIHPATKTFQALRITVNNELERFKKTLPMAFEQLSPGGRIAVISFHSLEDRITKRFCKEKAQSGKARLINKKPIVASEEEISDNPRSRSAKLRIIEKIAENNE